MNRKSSLFVPAFQKLIALFVQWNATDNKENKLVTHTTTRTHFKNISLSERLFTEDYTLHDSVYMKF